MYDNVDDDVNNCVGGRIGKEIMNDCKIDQTKNISFVTFH